MRKRGRENEWGHRSVAPETPSTISLQRMVSFVGYSGDFGGAKRLLVDLPAG